MPPLLQRWQWKPLLGVVSAASGASGHDPFAERLAMYVLAAAADGSHVLYGREPVSEYQGT